MQTAIVGAGPTGLFTAIALARRGHRVTLVDRDPGPAPDGSWERRGVMQFHHPHGLRRQVVDCLTAEMPDVLGRPSARSGAVAGRLDGLLAAGAELAVLPARDGRPAMVVGLHCRRMTFERVLRDAALAEPGVRLHSGHADEVLSSGGRASGLRVDGREIPFDLVINASGRAGRLAGDRRAPAIGGDCGLSYVSRQYALRPGAGWGPMNAPVGLIRTLGGYIIAVFLQDNRTYTTLIARPSDDRRLAVLRHTAAYEAATRAIPGMAEWVDDERGTPITPVLPGGRLHNTYRGQAGADGRVPLPGLIHLGDAVCTTNPTAGRGIALGLRQSRRLVELLGDGSGDPAEVTAAFDAWCEINIKPWYDDHVYWDADLLRRWAGGDVDLTRPLPSDLIIEAAQHDPSLMRVAGPFMAMDVPPSALAEIEPAARALYASGWRPAPHPGPSRDELAGLVSGVLR
jgi:2-polyprenyl-6-methoxyphenol hydroxylase-like FAD-dependent oxidoreductase